MTKIDDLSNLIEHDKDQMYRMALDCFMKLRSPSRILTYSLYNDAQGEGIS